MKRHLVSANLSDKGIAGKQMRRLTITLICLLALSSSGNSLTCLQCNGISQPRHCRYVASCFQGEVCAVEAVKNAVGQQLYNIGCVQQTKCSNKNQASGECRECCHTDLCNANGCGEEGYPQTRGPICYHCPIPVTINTCSTIDFCEAGEVCQYTVLEEFGDLVYTGQCTNSHVCATSEHHLVSIIGRDKLSPETSNSKHQNEFENQVRMISSSRRATNCDGCCESDLCNTGCNMTPRASDCYDIQQMGLGTGDGIYMITLRRTNRTVKVFCDLTTKGGGWTVFQNRFDGSVDFYRNFINYTSGFGNLNGEFWLGLDIIHEMTTNRLTELHIHVTDWKGREGYEIHKNFSVSEGPRYVLHTLPGYGTLGDGLSYNTGQPFSTFDHDYDSHYNDNCAHLMHGAWWFSSCYHCNLNGLYSHNSIDSSMRCVRFLDAVSLKTSTMMFRAQH